AGPGGRWRDRPARRALPGAARGPTGTGGGPALRHLSRLTRRAAEYATTRYRLRPVHRARATPGGEIAGIFLAGAPQEDPMRLLVVEDEKRLATGLRIGLEAEGFAVDIALDGTDGLQKARDNHYDALVLDLMLPGVNGDMICTTLRAAKIWTPI